MTADFLNEIKGAFGIKAVHVEFDGQVILDKGQFDNKPVWNGKLRGYR